MFRERAWLLILRHRDTKPADSVKFIGEYHSFDKRVCVLCLQVQWEPALLRTTRHAWTVHSAFHLFQQVTLMRVVSKYIGHSIEPSLSRQTQPRTTEEARGVPDISCTGYHLCRCFD